MFQGFGHWARASSHLTKATWAALMLISYGLFGFCAYQAIGDYAKGETGTRLEILSNDSLALPDIVFCLNTRFRMTEVTRSWPPSFIAAFQLGYSSHWQGVLTGNQTATLAAIRADIDAMVRAAGLSGADELFDPQRTPDFNTPTFQFCSVFRLRPHGWLLLRFNCTEVLGRCRIMSRQYECCEEARPVYVPRAGTCFRLDGPHQASGGFGMGLQVEVKVLEEEFLYPALNLFPLRGILFALVHRDAPSDGALKLMSPGQHHIATVRPTKVQRMSRGQAGCTEVTPETPARQTWEQREACETHCRNHLLIKECGCRFATSYTEMPLPRRLRKSNDTPCNFEELLVTCDEPLNRTFAQLGACLRDCPRPCWTWQYATELTSQTLVPELVQAYFPNRSLDQVRNFTDNRILFDLYYPELTLQRSTQYLVIESGSLFSNVGGILGVFTGGSIISIGHVVFFAVEALLFVCFGKMGVVKGFKNPALVTKTNPKPAQKRRVELAAAPSGPPSDRLETLTYASPREPHAGVVHPQPFLIPRPRLPFAIPRPQTRGFPQQYRTDFDDFAPGGDYE